MPQAWSQKDERMYDKIRKSSEKQGRSSKRSKEIAARTVNKKRRKEGRTENKQSQGTGNPNTNLDQRTKQELMNIARERDVSGRSSMNKSELIKAIRSNK